VWDMGTYQQDKRV